MTEADQRGRGVAAATDGACSGNPGPGGWGALIRFEDGSVEEFGGADPATTNNRMELQAALATLERLAELPLHPDLTLRTDSKYLIDGWWDCSLFPGNMTQACECSISNRCSCQSFSNIRGRYDRACKTIISRKR